MVKASTSYIISDKRYDLFSKATEANVIVENDAQCC